MTEWERMQKGLVYNDFDQDLFNKRVEAKKLFKAYNKTDDEEVDLRNKIMKQLFKNVGENVWIEPDFRCEFGKNITIGDNVYINFGCIILDCSEVTIGSHTLLGPNIGLYAANHSTDATERIMVVAMVSLFILVIMFGSVEMSKYYKELQSVITQ